MLENKANVLRFGNVSTNPYPISFPFWSPDEIIVYISKSAEGIDAKLNVMSDYTIDDVKNTVTLKAGVASRYNGYDKVTIQRLVANVQNTDYTNGTNIDAEILEQSLDKLTAQIQQNTETLSRAFTTSVSEEGANMTFPGIEARKNQLLGFGEDGKTPLLRSLEQFDKDVANTRSNAESASSSKTGADNACAKAKEWATKFNAEAPDTTQAVEADLYSAKKYAYDAGKQATAAAGSASAAAASAKAAKASQDDINSVITKNKDAIDTVRDNIEDVNAVASNTSNINKVASIDSNVTKVAENMEDVNAVADNLLVINIVKENLTDVNTVASGIDDVTKVSKDISNVNAVADNEDNINKAVANEANINKAVANEANINKAVANEANINKAVANEANINKVVENESNINTVAGSIGNVNITANNIENVNAVASNESNINKAVANEDNINTVAENVVDVNTVATDIESVKSVSSDLVNVDAVAGDLGNLDAVAGNLEDVLNAPKKALEAQAKAEEARDTTLKTKEATDLLAQSASESATQAQEAQTEASKLSLKAEGYATGTQNSEPVKEGSEYYQNNSKYYFDAIESGLIEKADKAKTAYKTDLEIDSTTFKLTPKTYNEDGILLSEGETVDLPLETMVIGAEYDEEAKSILIKLQNGTDMSVPVASLISGLVNQNDIVDNLTSTDTAKPLSANQGRVLKSAIDAKYTKASSGIPKSDLSKEVQDALSVNPNAVTYISQTLSDAQKKQARQNIGAIANGDQITGSFVGPLTGNVTGNTNGLHTGDVKGNVSGNVKGDVTGNLTGNVKGDVTGNVNAEGTKYLVWGAVFN